MASLHLACSAPLRPSRLAASLQSHRRCLQPAAASRRLPPLTAAAAAAPAPAVARHGGGSGSRPAPPATARAQRLEKAAEEVAADVQRSAVRADRKSAGFPAQAGTDRVAAVAARLLRAGMSRAGAVRLLRDRPGLLDADQRLLAAHMDVVRGVTRGAPLRRGVVWCGAEDGWIGDSTRGAVCSTESTPGRPCPLAGAHSKRISLSNRLGSAAADAALARRPPEAFAASCKLVAELAAAAEPFEPRACSFGDVLRQCTGDRVAWLLSGQRDPAELRAVFGALQQRLGWTAQQAGSALLGLGLRFASARGCWRATSQGVLPLQLHRTTVQHVELVGDVLR